MYNMDDPMLNVSCTLVLDKAHNQQVVLLLILRMKSSHFKVTHELVSDLCKYLCFYS